MVQQCTELCKDLCKEPQKGHLTPSLSGCGSVLSLLMNFRFHLFSSQQSRAASSGKAGPTKARSFALHGQQFCVLRLYVAPGMCRGFFMGLFNPTGRTLAEDFHSISNQDVQTLEQDNTNGETFLLYPTVSSAILQKSLLTSYYNILIRTTHCLFSLLPKPHSFRKEPIQRNLTYHCRHFSCDAKPQGREEEFQHIDKT